MEGLNVRRGIGATRRLDDSCTGEEASYLVHDTGEVGDCAEAISPKITRVVIDERPTLRKLPYPPRSKVRTSARLTGVACNKCGFADGIEVEVESVTTRLFVLEDDGRYHENPLLPRYSEETVTYLCGNCHEIICDRDITLGARFVCDSITSEYETNEEKDDG